MLPMTNNARMRPLCVMFDVQIFRIHWKTTQPPHVAIDLHLNQINASIDLHIEFNFLITDFY